MINCYYHHYCVDRSTRLANLDHTLQALLVEVGEDNLNNPWLKSRRAREVISEVNGAVPKTVAEPIEAHLVA
jgi:hypothetical protein